MEPHNQSIEAQETKLRDALLKQMLPVTPERELERMAQGIMGGRSGAIERSRRRGSLPQWVRYSMVVAAIVVGYMGWNSLRPANQANTPVTKTYTTLPGQRASIALPDGSRVILAPASSLRVSLQPDRRTVELSGSAFFDIQHATRSPFTVRTGNALTTVLGTSFGIRKYEQDSAVVVAVKSGKVAVNSVLLSNGDAATVGSSGVTAMTRSSDVERLLSWTNGRLVFVDAPLAEVAAELSRWYGNQIVVHPSLSARRVNTVVDAPVLTANRLAVLEQQFGARLHREGNTILIEP